jgi:lipopolysaccharide transport system permease protein
LNDTEIFETNIDSRFSFLDFKLKEAWHYRYLVWLLVKRDFISLYKQTILGPAWAVIQPFLTTVAIAFIFGRIAGLAANGVPAFLFYLVAVVAWSYFSGCLTACANVFIGNQGILGKVYFPRIVIPVSAILSKLIDFFIQFVLFVVILTVYVVKDSNVVPNWYICMTPLLVFQLALLGLGCGIIVSSLTTRYRDLALLVAFAVQLWMYVSPVAYDISIVPARLLPLYMLNPVSPVILAFRYMYLGTGSIDWTFYAISWVTTILILFLGLLLFNRVEKTFMDTV